MRHLSQPKRKLKELSDIQELILRCKTLRWEKIKFYADHFNEWPTIEAFKVEESKNE